MRVFGEIRKPFFHAKTAEYQRFQDIRRKQRMYGNVRQCQHFRYPARYPSWVPNKTADDCTANRPSCRQWS
nr:MAG TPA_asm: hypothetical protein [Caudoviricetes sp.]